MNFSDYATSHIRTFVPIVVGMALSWVAAKGLDLSSAQPWLVAVLTSACIALYYSAARLVERRWPAAGKYLLGKGGQPRYPEYVGKHSSDPSG